MFKSDLEILMQDDKGKHGEFISIWRKDQKKETIKFRLK